MCTLCSCAVYVCWMWEENMREQLLKCWLVKGHLVAVLLDVSCKSWGEK